MLAYLTGVGQISLDSEKLCCKIIHVTLITYVFSSEHLKFLLTVFLTYKYFFIITH